MRTVILVSKMLPPALIAGLLAGLLGFLAASGFGPLSDILLRWSILNAPKNKVILVLMDGARDEGAWSRTCQLLLDRGASAVGLVGRDLPVLTGVVTWDPTPDGLDQATFPLDADGRTRTWSPGEDGRPTFPARLLQAASLPGLEGTGRIPLASVTLPTLNHDQVSGLAPGALTGRVAVLGLSDPWRTPTVNIPGRPIPLSEAILRVLTDPRQVDAPAPAVALGSALLAGLTTLMLLQWPSPRHRAAILVGVGAAGLGAILAGTDQGMVVPVDALVGALLSTGLLTFVHGWRATGDSMQALVDDLVSRLGDGMSATTLAADETWAGLGQVAVSWGGASAAWTLWGRPGHWSSQQTAGSVPPIETVWLDTHLPDDIDVDAGFTLPAPPGMRLERDLLVLPVHWDGTIFGLLVLHPAPDQPPALDALRQVARYVAAQIRRAPRRHGAPEQQATSIAVRLAEMAAGIEYVLTQRDLLLASHRGSRTAHAIYDPLGKPLVLDDSFRTLLGRLGLSADNSVAAIWASFQGSPADLAQVLGGAAPIRSPAPVRGMGVDAWLHACVHRDTVIGIALEMPDVSVFQAQDTVKSGLLEMVGYRLSNIVTAIRGYADLLTMGSVDASEVAPRIVARCAEMAEILQKYEGAMREQDGTHTTPVRILDLVQEVVAGGRRTLGEHRVRLTDTPATLPPVIADHNALARALMNLVLEMAHDVKDDVAVVLTARAVPGGVEVEIRTDGPGLPVPLLRQLMAAEHAQGSALAARLVGEMGGSLTVVGGGEEGSRFRVYLPEA